MRKSICPSFIHFNWPPSLDYHTCETSHEVLLPFASVHEPPGAKAEYLDFDIKLEVRAGVSELNNFTSDQALLRPKREIKNEYEGDLELKHIPAYDRSADTLSGRFKSEPSDSDSKPSKIPPFPQYWLPNEDVANQVRQA
jgi:hypothetical protein